MPARRPALAGPVRTGASGLVALRRRRRDGLGVSRAYEAPGQDRRKEHEQCTGQKQGVIVVSKTRDGQHLNVGGSVAWNAEPREFSRRDSVHQTKPIDIRDIG